MGRSKVGEREDERIVGITVWDSAREHSKIENEQSGEHYTGVCFLG